MELSRIKNNSNKTNTCLMKLASWPLSMPPTQIKYCLSPILMTAGNDLCNGSSDVLVMELSTDLRSIPI